MSLACNSIPTTQPVDDLDFVSISDDEPELPCHLIPTEYMTQRFIQNCKELGVWE